MFQISFLREKKSYLLKEAQHHRDTHSRALRVNKGCCCILLPQGESLWHIHHMTEWVSKKAWLRENGSIIVFFFTRREKEESLMWWIETTISIRSGSSDFYRIVNLFLKLENGSDLPSNFLARAVSVADKAAVDSFTTDSYCCLAASARRFSMASVQHVDEELLLLLREQNRNWFPTKKKI